MMNRSTILLLTSLMAACQPTPAPKPVLDVPDPSNRPPLPTAPSAPAPALGDDCDHAYEHLRSIGCTPAAPASGTWQDVCRNGREHGVFSLTCINDAQTLAEAQKCGACTTTNKPQ